MIWLLNFHEKVAFDQPRTLPFVITTLSLYILLISYKYEVERCAIPVVYLYVSHARDLIHELYVDYDQKRLIKYFFALLHYFFILFHRVPTKSSMLKKLSTFELMPNSFIFYFWLSQRGYNDFHNSIASCVGGGC